MSALWSEPSVSASFANLFRITPGISTAFWRALVSAAANTRDSVIKVAEGLLSTLTAPAHLGDGRYPL